MVKDVAPRNMALLRRRHPDLCLRLGEIKTFSDCRVQISKSGCPTVRYRNVLLHSGYDPVAEAQGMARIKEIDRALEHNEPLIIFGFGLGYHVKVFLERAGRVTVVEPNMEILALAFRTVDLTDILERTDLVVDRAYKEDMARATWFFHQPTVRTNPEAHAFWRDFLKIYRERRGLPLPAAGPADGKEGNVDGVAPPCYRDGKGLDEIVDQIPHRSDGRLDRPEAIWLLMKAFEDLERDESRGPRDTVKECPSFAEKGI